MTTSPAILRAALLSVLLTSAPLFAGTAAETAKASLPKPVKVVEFSQLPLRFENATVNFLLTIDENGVPREITGQRRLPDDLAKSLLPALRQWRFSPARDKDGNPVAMRVLLPLQLVPKDEVRHQPTGAYAGTNRKHGADQASAM